MQPENIELNQKEKDIVELIGKLSVIADDESTTQEAIDRMVESIRRNTSENIKDELEKVESEKKKNAENSEGDRKDSMEMEEPAVARHHQHYQTPRLSNQLFFTRIREVQKPGKAHPTDAGIDFYVPDEKAWDADFRNKVVEYSRNPVPSPQGDGVWFDENVLHVGPGSHVAIPSGIKTIIPVGYGMMMVNKSGIATKMKLDHSACLIDSEYRDELIFCFFNHNTEPIEITPGMKITQGLVVPIINLQVQEVLNCVYDEIASNGNDRGGGFGSSGR